MSIDIICSKCGKGYVCELSNTRMVGPILETRCPFCKVKLSRNLSAFVQEQSNLRAVRGRINTAKFMINMSVEMGKLINEDVPYSGQKKVIKIDDLPEL